MKKQLISILLICSFLFLFGCRKAPEEEIMLKEPVAEKIGTVIVERGDLRDTVILDAFVVPEEVELSLPISGIVDELPFMTGDRAEKGELLLKLDTYQVEKEIAVLRAEIEDLEVQASYEQRIYELDVAYQDRLITGYWQQGAGWQSIRLAQLEKEDLELTHSEYIREYERKMSEKAEALEEKQEIYDSSFLYAPVSGIVYYVDSGYQAGVSMSITEGARTEKDQTLVYIADETRKHIDLEDRMTAELRGLPCFAMYQGEEVEIEAIPLSSEQRIRDSVLARKDAYRYRIMHRTMTDMKPGDYIPVYYVKESYEDVLYVPLSAVYRDAELLEDYVYRMNPEGGHERVSVECRQCGVYMVIQSGLSEGDELYVVR